MAKIIYKTLVIKIMQTANVEVLLSAWGKWAVRIETKSIGYPSTSPMFREARFGKGFGSSEPIGISDDDMKAVDSAVQSLPLILKITIKEFYKRECSIRDLSMSLGCDKSAAGRYLNEGRRRVANYIEAVG